MRWKRPEIGDVRTVRRLLLLPREINNIVKWLCMAMVQQKYSTIAKICSSGGLAPYDEWVDIKFMEK